MILRAQGLLTLIRSQTFVSPARNRLIMVGSLVSDSALTVAPCASRNGSSTCAEPSEKLLPAAKAAAMAADRSMKLRRVSFDFSIRNPPGLWQDGERLAS